MTTGAEHLTGPRGADPRLENRQRPTREEKRQDYADRKAARAATRAEMEKERRSGLWTDYDSDNE